MSNPSFTIRQELSQIVNRIYSNHKERVIVYMGVNVYIFDFYVNEFKDDCIILQQLNRAQHHAFTT